MANYVPIEDFLVFDLNQGDTNITLMQNVQAPYDVKVISSPPLPFWPVLHYPTNTNRSTPIHQQIFDTCDNTTHIATKADIRFPYAYAEVTLQAAICGFNGGGGSCTLYIQRVVVEPVSGPSSNDGVAQIMPAGTAPSEDVEFSLDGANWQTNNNYFPGLAPGNYTARVRNQNACNAQYLFTVPAFIPVPLKIKSLVVVHETAPLANDGKVTIEAEGSATPFTYSIDGVSYQSSNVFTGLAPGAQTAYVKDANSTVVERAFMVEPFSAFINAEPSVTIGNNTSYWLAAHNVISFRFQRQDYKILDISESNASNPNPALRRTLILLDKPMTTIFAPGEVVMVKSANYNGGYFVIEANGNTVVIDAPYVYAENETGILNGNDKVNYRIELKIETAAGQISLGYFSPDALGLTDCHIQGKIRNLVNNRNEFMYNVRNWLDHNAFSEFDLYYRETWDMEENEPAPWELLPNTYFAVNAAKQIGDPYGSNMAEYVTYPDGNPRARFLTSFKQPTYFIGYPFDLSFIFSELIQDGILEVNEISLNVNGDQVVNDTALLASDYSFLFTENNQLIIMEDDSNTRKILKKNTGVHRLMVNGYYIYRTHKKEVRLLHTLSGKTTQVSETKIINVNNGCRKKPVYIAWLNTLGGWDYWLYDTTQKVTLSVNGVKTYERFIENVSTAEGTVETISKEAIDRVTVGDTVDIETFKSLRRVMFSPKVLLLYGQEPVKWITVQVEPGSLSYETGAGTADIEFSIILPQINIQNN